MGNMQCAIVHHWLRGGWMPLMIEDLFTLVKILQILRSNDLSTKLCSG